MSGGVCHDERGVQLFELLKDIVQNHIAMSRVAAFHLFLTPLVIYRTMPFAVLLAVLVTFG